MNAYYNPNYYFEKCFPTLYPYGYGGPSDKNFKMKGGLSKYFKYVLQNNGGSDGRRFQSNPNFIFVAYHYEFKHRFSNVSFMAEKPNNKLNDIMNVNRKELDEIIATKTGQTQARAETERITRNNDLKKIEDLFNKLKQEKKRIKKLLK